ncbi:MAG: ribonuclease P protein component [Clostridiales bacterium]|jgi:ribonuclease P protein component|nr:ribonuclease P protein component [Clostridiales bacterium]
MKNTESLKKNNRFRNVYKNGKSYANKYLVLYVLPNSQSLNRLGLTVSKKVGNSVVRSRVTRKIREAYRLNEDRFLCGYDIVFIARVVSGQAVFLDIEKSVLYLAKKCGIIC